MPAGWPPSNTAPPWRRVYAALDAGIDVHVWVSETRPRNQGLLTAWELEQHGVPHTLIADNAAGLLLAGGGSCRSMR